jgi:glycosyltransferase involved in cell wall biosynthesis
MSDSYQYSDVAIGITTFNRPRLLEACTRSLNRVTGIEDARILVTDDCSTDYDAAFLKACFPAQAMIERNSTNGGGADFACRAMIERLCNTDAKILIVTDSDLVFAKDCLDQTFGLIKATDGFLSLFNTPTHPATGARGGLILKKGVGAAGTVWRSDVAQAMLVATPAGPVFDWRFCEYLTSVHIDIVTVKASLVQHLGFAQGQNSSARGGDIGIGFTDADAFNAYLMQQELAYALNGGFKEIATRFDQQRAILEAHMKAIKGTFDLLKAAQDEIAQLQMRIDRLEAQYAPPDERLAKG